MFKSVKARCPKVAASRTKGIEGFIPKVAASRVKKVLVREYMMKQKRLRASSGAGCSGGGLQIADSLAGVLQQHVIEEVLPLILQVEDGGHRRDDVLRQRSCERADKLL